jgi:hypothetical protein
VGGFNNRQKPLRQTQRQTAIESRRMLILSARRLKSSEFFDCEVCRPGSRAGTSSDASICRVDASLNVCNLPLARRLRGVLKPWWCSPPSPVRHHFFHDDLNCLAAWDEIRGIPGLWQPGRCSVSMLPGWAVTNF